MTKTQFAKEVGMVAAIMADAIFTNLYVVCQKNGTGYISAAEILSDWALEFVLKHEKTNWEELLEKAKKPLSNQISEVICWDDCVYDYAHYKLELLIR